MTQDTKQASKIDTRNRKAESSGREHAERCARRASSSSPAKRSGAGEGDRPQGGGGGLLAPTSQRFPEFS